MDKKLVSSVTIAIVAAVVAPVWVSIPVAFMAGTFTRKKYLPKFMQ